MGVAGSCTWFGLPLLLTNGYMLMIEIEATAKDGSLRATHLLPPTHYRLLADAADNGGSRN